MEDKMIIRETKSTFKNPYRYGAYWVVDLSANGNDFYCLARNPEEIIQAFPETSTFDIVDNTEMILSEGPAPQSMKRLLSEEKFGKVVCSVGDGLHQRKWRWFQDSKE